MALVVICPEVACRKRIGLPDHVSMTASVRCPFCNSVFKAAAAMELASAFSHMIEQRSNLAAPLPNASNPASLPIPGGGEQETRSVQEQQTTNPVPIEGPSDSSDSPKGTISFVPEHPEDKGAAGTKVATPEVGDRVGRFRLRRVLGEGAFGKVYEAYDPQLDRVVALKVAKLDRGDAGQRLKRFLREAKAAANLRHPNIVPLYEYGEEGDEFFLALAYIEGATLADLIRQQKESSTRDFRQAASIIAHLAEALAYAHSQAIIHRDIKPANIMLDRSGEPLLMDFGLATWPQDEKLTVEGSVMGTPAYMSPEQCRGDTSAASDQYSLGVTLFQLLTGQTPFQGPIDRQMYQQVHDEPPAPRLVNRQVPSDLDTICLRCLEKDSSRRFANCQALADDLRRWLKGEPIQARRVGPMEKVVKWGRRKPGIASLVAVVIVVAVTGFGAVLYQLGQTYNALDLASTNATNFENASILAKENESRAIEALKNETTALASQKTALKNESAARISEKIATRKQAQNLYTAHMNLVQRYWDQAEPHLAKALLEKHIPEKPGDPDFRAFEWYYYWKLCNSYPPALRNLPSFVRALAWSPVDKTLAYSCGNQVFLWDSDKKDEPVPMPPFKDTVTSLAFAPDGKTLALGAGDPGKAGLVYLWDMENKKIRAVLAGHKYAVTTVAYTPDGTELVSGSTNIEPGNGGQGTSFFYTGSSPRIGEIKRWNPVSGELIDFFGPQVPIVEDQGSAAFQELGLPTKPIKLPFGWQPATFKNELVAKDLRYKKDRLHKLYLIELKSGIAYQFDHISKDFDAYLYLEDPEGNLIKEDDDSGGG